MRKATMAIGLVSSVALVAGIAWTGGGQGRTDDRAAVAGRSAGEAQGHSGTAEPASGASVTPHKAAHAGRPFIGKPRPPVEVRLATAARLDSGVPGRVTLEVRSGVALEDLELRLEGDEGLALVGAATHRLPPLAAGEGRRLDVDVTPISGGTRRLSGFLAFTVGGQSQRVPVSLSLPVAGPDRVGVASAKPQAAPEIDSTGEAVYSMTAETTVVQR